MGGLRAAYRQRRDVLSAALTEHLPECCSFTIPGGGYFLWLTLPDRIDTTALLADADAHRVAFIPGQRLCIDGRGRNCLRLAFSLMMEFYTGSSAPRRAVQDSIVAAMARFRR